MKAAAPHTPVVHLVDDDADFQAAIARVLRLAGYEVRCYSNAGEFLVTQFDDQRPACILLDVRMPGPSGLDIQDVLARMNWHRPIVFLSGYNDTATTVRAIQAGAEDFLSKPVARETLLGAVGRALLRDVEGRSARELLRNWKSRLAKLTPRELAVLDGVVAGKLNKVIGVELGVAERTIKTHRARVMEKMGAETLAELVHIADQLRGAGELRDVAPARR
jgi:FixJ family two-component response regulator